MSADIPALAALMGLATYGTRLVPFLLPVDRLPPSVTRSLRLAGPASMASLAGIIVLLPGAGAAAPTVVVWVASGACAILVAARRNLAIGVIIAFLIALLAPR